MSTDAIERLNSQGMREEFAPLKIVDDCREALYAMPGGKEGIVVGSGSNTESWRARGWQTLDIAPGSNADIIHDANWMADILPPESQDYIYAEAIRMDPNGIEGASPARLLNQFNRVLKPGGKLIIETAHFEGIPISTLPDREQYIKLLQDNGFHGIAELGPISYLNPERTKYQQSVVYYGEKKRSGFKISTGEIVHPE